MGETEHQVVNAIDMEMRARRAEREAKVARDEAWKERIMLKAIVIITQIVFIFKRYCSTRDKRSSISGRPIENRKR